MINTLYVAWQQPKSNEWIVVAKLHSVRGSYQFSYTRGALRAKGFQPFHPMNKLDVIYEAPVLLPLFSNRLINKSRPDYKSYLRWLGLAAYADDPMTMLALTGGIRETDSIELFQPPQYAMGLEFQLDFFARGLSYLPKETINLVSQLNVGSELFLMKDCQSSFDSLALALRSSSAPVFAGYCPKYYAQDFRALLDEQNTGLRVCVKCVNLDAPLNMRLLCTDSANTTTAFFSREVDGDFKPVENSGHYVGVDMRSIK